MSSVKKEIDNIIQDGSLDEAFGIVFKYTGLTKKQTIELFETMAQEGKTGKEMMNFFCEIAQKKTNMNAFPSEGEEDYEME